jgi:hypothetical protein
LSYARLDFSTQLIVSIKMRFTETLVAAALLSALGAAAPIANNEKRTEFAPWYRATNILPATDEKRDVEAPEDKRAEFAGWYRATNIIPYNDDKRDVKAPEEKRDVEAPEDKRAEFAGWYRATNIIPYNDDE